MTPPRRSPTQTERDEESYLAKIKRDEAAAERLAVPHEVDDPVTGQYIGPELEKMRDEREPIEDEALRSRMKRIERRLDTGDRVDDDLRKQNAALLATVLKMSGVKFESNTTNIELNAATKRNLVTRIVLAVAGLITIAGTAIAGYFLGRKS